MSDIEPKQIACSACSQALDPTDRFCRRCGRSCGSKTPFHHQPWFVLVLLFGIVGPFALPLLWRSKGFSRPQKVVITVLQVLFVWFLLSGIVRGYMMYMQFISNLGI